jgi:AraC family transcriptional regulator
MKSTHAAIDAPLKLEAPRVERGKPMLLAGLRQRFNPATAREIPALWQRFVPHLGGIPGRVDRATWGVVFAMGAGGAFDCLAGVEVAPGSRLPAEFFQLAIPALTYLVFVHPGHVSRLKDAVTEIWTDLLPASGHRPAAGAGGAPGMLERYGAGFNPRTGFGDIELWIPILP